MRVFLLVLGSMLTCGEALWASKYPLIINKARSGVDLRVEIASKILSEATPLGEIDADVRNYLKESLIDKLATFKNPLEAHIDLTRYWLVANNINDGNLIASETFAAVTDGQEIDELKEYEPPQSEEAAQEFVAMRTLLQAAMALSMEISTALQKDERFMAAFAVEDQRGVDLDNFLYEQRRALENEQIDHSDNDSLQELRAIDSAAAEQTQEAIVLMAKLNNKAARTESAFMRTVATVLVSKLLEGTDTNWPVLTGNDLPLPAARETVRLRKEFWLAIYQHLRHD